MLAEKDLISLIPALKALGIFDVLQIKDDEHFKLFKKLSMHPTNYVFSKILGTINR